MVEPTKKADAVDRQITITFGIDRRTSIRNDVCAWCDTTVGQFRDQVSEKEYTISGLCQKCQDQVYG